MEWIETTGRTAEEALEEAAKHLGVRVGEVEHEVLEPGKPGLFGRTRVDARIRARVAPRSARPKATKAGAKKRPASASSSAQARAPRVPSTPRPPREFDREQAVDQAAVAAIAIEFLDGLFEAIGVEATCSWYTIDEETLQIDVDGDQLGFLVGRGGATLQALQDLMRLRVHHSSDSRSGRMMLDVAGYRQKRKVALEAFTDRVAAEVIEAGERRALEPMAAVDRKVIHDRVGTIDGVRSESEGEEPDRRVVLMPA
jgi:spoIIIJ-associated protein